MPWMPRLIGLVGYARTGKDTIAGILEQYDYERISFADPLREIAKSAGWEGTKSDKDRKILQDLGMAIRENLSNPFTYVAGEQIAETLKNGNKVVVTDARFFDEFLLIRAHGGVLWRVVRNGTEPALGHISDTGMDSWFDYDGIIGNNGSIEELQALISRTLGVNDAPKYESEPDSSGIVDSAC